MNAAVSFIGGTNGNKKGLAATLSANPGELKLRASLSDTNFTDGSTLNLDDLLLSVEKPGSFIVDFDIPKKVLTSFLFTQKIAICVTKMFVKEMQSFCVENVCKKELNLP